ncbi:ubiquitin fusion degradation protein UFD1 family protein [Heterostelium album PN500]|uniref:Ubiquitin fusion degradation protein UFD1 family protein n=1 Tax=Heterostelium pallidum (strain ATCC 26659 / Pp 5 / PN500) TaxID=670386 RepID=D3BU02_HETP5|nr:ubiquitin fusion degradation protein UFD1 family protein [Heterostelium album PN500]EFA75188.1 ubiquitin fusion degradation protein UFD1 family protein [Heterostelium album PN500]|eukprot:XP_020427322.1 ubiquitin fusion degradation protein UFD1 family protein [Heterostelium album PN500]
MVIIIDINININTLLNRQQGGMPATGKFNQNYCVMNIAIAGKAHLESGGKILLPPSALNTLSRLHIQFPMQFEISNTDKHRSSHCGVLEFTAEEGVCYMPKWMMNNLQLKDQDIVTIKSATLPNGQFVKIQPHTQAFLETANPKAILENALRKFATLTKAEDFVIEYNNKNYTLRVLEIKPVNPSNAISIIETDISVDFAPPLDSKPEETYKPQTTGFTFGTTSVAKLIPPGSSKKPQNDSDEEESSDEDEPKFKAFGGTAARLDGKSGTPSTPPKNMLGTSPKPQTNSPPVSELIQYISNFQTKNPSLLHLLTNRKSIITIYRTTAITRVIRIPLVFDIIFEFS